MADKQEPEATVDEVSVETEVTVETESGSEKTDAGLIESAFLFGLGAATATANAAQALAKTMVEQGKMTQDQASKMAQDLARRADAQTKDIQKTATSTSQRAAGAVGFATKADIERLEAEIADLKSRLGAKPMTDTDYVP